MLVINYKVQMFLSVTKPFALESSTTVSSFVFPQQTF